MNIKKEFMEDVKYIIFGVIAAYLLNFGLGLALDTDLPIVAVVSDSMTHDSLTPIRHYEFLQNELGYSKEEIDSWPLSNGFPKGHILIVKGVNKEELKVGDVIVYNIAGQSVPIVHRIVKFNGDEIVTKGDHNPSYDPWKVEKIHGKAIFVIPYLGWPKLLLARILVSLR